MLARIIITRPLLNIYDAYMGEFSGKSQTNKVKVATETMSMQSGAKRWVHI